MKNNRLLLILLLVSLLPAFRACEDCSSLANNDNLPPGYEVMLTDQPENMGEYILLSGNIPSLVPYNFSGRMDSLRYSRIIHPQVFEKPGFTGKQLVLPFGITELPELPVFGSLKVPVGMSVKLTTIYGPRFSKREIVITSDSEQLPVSEPVEKIDVSFLKPEL